MNMSRFGDNPLIFFESVYQETAPWDIGAPQPALMELIKKYPPKSMILDAGCGTGDTAIALAEMGHQILGIDFVDSAIDQAKQKQKKLKTEIASNIEFIKEDLFQIRNLNRKFGSVIDSGFYHLFDKKQGNEYLQNIASVMESGGILYMLEFAIEFDIPNGPRTVTEEEIKHSLSQGNGWKILEIRHVQFENKISPVPAIAVCAQRIK